MALCGAGSGAKNMTKSVGRNRSPSWVANVLPCAQTVSAITSVIRQNAEFCPKLVLLKIAVSQCHGPTK